MRSLKLMLATLVAVVALQGCAFWQKVKPIVSTVDDIARSMCAQWYGEQMGMSVDDALKLYCNTREAWAPWIDPALAASKMGGQVKLGKAIPPSGGGECLPPEQAPPEEPPEEPASAPDPDPAATPQPEPETAPQAEPGPSKEGD